MSDLNFFEPYIEKRDFKFNKMILLYMLFVLCIAVVVAVGVYNQVQINMLKAQVKDRRALAEDPVTVNKYNEIKVLEDEMAVFSKEVDNIIKMDKNIAKNDIISEKLMSEIESKMPVDLFMTNFSANGRDIQISGVAKDSNSVAIFSKGLGLIEDVESVFISNIDNVEGNYNFVLNTIFKDVNIDEQKTQE
ncbi:MAG: PilN domain-containing protein [Tissierellia bacterium]|nr:PilN domain-containing protein [Tissierellia bacterium]MDD3227099.1 PilN domain-containing protein [Tissierellia bacterium]MDD4046721.1 PilN domain-containing protein [Tissierellia bacterium]MDD4678358.1 PilN domain-containing protein [Tissierellia bacterium]